MIRFSLPFSNLLPVVIGMLLFANSATLSAVTVIQDTFDNNVVSSGATTLPGSTWSPAGGTITESGGSMNFATPTNSSQWSTSTINSAASAGLNIFTSTVSVAIRDLAFTGSGDHANPNSRFRFGIMGRDSSVGTNGTNTNTFGSFYNNGNDGISVNFTANATTGFTNFTIQYKADATSLTDPNVVPTGGSSSVNFVATGVDFTANATSWSITLLGAAAQSTTFSGTWNLAPFAGTWGNATDGFGNSGFVMGVQTMGGAGADTVFQGNVTASVGSLLVTSVPEPSRVVLLFAAACGLLTVRRRSRQR